MSHTEIEGVVKYEVRHQNRTSELFDGYEALEALRRRLYALGLIGEKDGIGYGNISMRTSNSFFITATQTGSHHNLSSQYYTKITDYSFEDFSVTSQGEYLPSSEALSHAMIYDLAPEISVVIHIHSLTLWNFMIDKDVISTTASYGTIKMTKEIKTLYQTHNPLIDNAFVMKGHKEGVMIFGRDLEEAELTLYRIIGGCLGYC